MHGPYWHPRVDIDAVISLDYVTNAILERARASYLKDAVAVVESHFFYEQKKTDKTH